MMPQTSNAKAIRTSSHVHTTMTTINSTQVVIKVVQANCTNLDYLRLKREVEVLTQIQNERFPRILDQFENATRFGVVEEYLAGQELGEWVTKTNPSKKQRILVFIQILDLVEILHQHGFLHMGIQLEDLLIQNEKVYLTNFKNCLPIGSLRPLIDSKIELPPEALKGMALDLRADQISLGKIYEQLVGHSLWLKKAQANRVNRRFSSLMTWKKCLKISLVQNLIWIGIASSFTLTVILIIVLKTSLFGSDASLPHVSQKPQQPMNQSSTIASESVQQTKPISNALTSENGDEQELQYGICIEIYERLAQNPEQILEVKTWTSYAKKALEQSYLPLAGYLLDHMPPSSKQSNFEFQLYEFELGVFCQKETGDSLNWLLLNIVDQPEWDQWLSHLLECLFINQITVDQSLLEELIQQLDKQVPLSNALCINLLNYILFLQSQQTTIWQIPDSVANDLQVHAPELYGMFIKTQIE
ncbi:MAG: serine/threonine-protein kinase [Erysipelotrichaceae bacterium]|nr:serine/threonine-protein kinase [Erysipelotrichaceae bacterium]